MKPTLLLIWIGVLVQLFILLQLVTLITVIGIYTYDGYTKSMCIAVIPPYNLTKEEYDNYYIRIWNP